MIDYILIGIIVFLYLAGLVTFNEYLDTMNEEDAAKGLPPIVGPANFIFRAMWPVITLLAVMSRGSTNE